MEERPPEVEVDKCHSTPGTGKGDAQVGDRRRLPFSRHRRGHHDCPRPAMEVQELDAGLQTADALRFDALRLREQHELIDVADASRRRRNAPEQRQLKLLLELLLRADTPVERLGEERECDSEHEAEEPAEEGAPFWLRPYLRRALGWLEDARVVGEKRSDRLELCLVLEELRVSGRRSRTGCLRVLDLLADDCQCVVDTPRVQPSLVPREAEGVRVCEADGRSGARRRDGDIEDVGVRFRAHARGGEQAAAGHAGNVGGPGHLRR